MGGSGNKSPASKFKSYDESYSKYAKRHKETVDFVKKQIGVDLNKYRDGDGSSPFTTSFWDKSGFKVAVNTKHMDKKDFQALKLLTTKYNGKVKLEEGGAWFHYVYLSK